MKDTRRVQRLPLRIVTRALPALAGLLLAVPASAQVFGQFGPANVLERGDRTLGVYGLFADQSWGGLGVARAGLGHALDAGVALGFSSHEDSPLAEGPNTLLLGVDVRHQIRWAQPDAPVDASVGLGLALETGSGFTRRALAPMLLASHRILYGDGARAVTPYGSVAIEYESVSTSGRDDSDLDMRARIGGMWEASPRLGLSAELAFGGEVVFAAGARWPF